ncbi:MAG: glycosyltransferase [Nitrospinota bacterium]
MTAPSRLRAALLSMHTDPLGSLGGDVSGGMNVYIRETARVLPALGVEADIFTRASDDGSPSIANLAPGVRLIRIPAGPKNPLEKNEQACFTGEFASGIHAFAESQEGGYDIVSSHYWLSALAGQGLADGWGTPLIHRFHTLAARKNESLPEEADRETGDRAAAEIRIAQRADALIASTGAEAADLAHTLGADKSKVHIIPCGVDPGNFSPLPRTEARAALGWSDEERILLNIGRIEPVKGLDRLVRAIATMKKSRPGFSIAAVHVGGEVRASARAENTGYRPEDFSSSVQREEVARILEIAAEAGASENIRFEGPKSQDDLRVYYSAADALTISSRYETFGLVALEAAACGLPAVAFRTGGLAEAIEADRTGLLVPEGDIAAYAAATLKITASPDLRDQLGTQARRRARAFSWTETASKEAAVWKNLLRRSVPAVPA